MDVVREIIDPNMEITTNANKYKLISRYLFIFPDGLMEKKESNIKTAQNFKPATSRAQPIPYRRLSFLPIKPVETMKLSTHGATTAFDAIICDKMH